MRTVAFIGTLAVAAYGLTRAFLALFGIEGTPPDAFWGWWAVAGVAMLYADWTSRR